MPGFTDYLRMAMGWWAKGTVALSPQFGCAHALSAYIPGGTAKQRYNASGTGEGNYQAGGTGTQKAC